MGDGEEGGRSNLEAREWRKKLQACQMINMPSDNDVRRADGTFIFVSIIRFHEVY